MIEDLNVRGFINYIPENGDLFMYTGNFKFRYVANTLEDSEEPSEEPYEEIVIPKELATEFVKTVVMWIEVKDTEEFINSCKEKGLSPTDLRFRYSSPDGVITGLHLNEEGLTVRRMKTEDNLDAYLIPLQDK